MTNNNHPRNESTQSITECLNLENHKNTPNKHNHWSISHIKTKEVSPELLEEIRKILLDENSSSSSKVLDRGALSSYLVAVELSKKEKHDLLKLIDKLIDNQNNEIRFNRQTITELLEVLKLKSSSQPININNSNSQKGDANMNSLQTRKNIGIENMSGGSISGNATVAGVINKALLQQYFTQATTEIQALLEKLAQTYPTETLSQKAIVAEKAIKTIENNPIFRDKILAVIKAMEMETFMAAINHPVANVLRVALEEYREEI